MSKHTDREKLQALLDGKKLMDEGKDILFIREDNLFYTKSLDDLDNAVPALVGGTCFPLWKVYEEPKWYANIPEQGVLCRVWDSKEIHATIAIVVCYDTDFDYPYRTSSTGYTNAEPIKLAALEPYILKG